MHTYAYAHKHTATFVSGHTEEVRHNKLGVSAVVWRLYKEFKMANAEEKAEHTCIAMFLSFI